MRKERKEVDLEEVRANSRSEPMLIVFGELGKEAARVMKGEHGRVFAGEDVKVYGLREERVTLEAIGFKLREK